MRDKLIAAFIACTLALTVLLMGSGASARRDPRYCTKWHQAVHEGLHTGRHFGPVEGERRWRWHDLSHNTLHQHHHLGPVECAR